MSELIIIFSLLYFTAIGFAIFQIFNFPPKNYYLKIPLYFGIGSGLGSVQLYLYSRTNLSWNPILLILPWAILFLISLKRVSKENLYSLLKPKIFRYKETPLINFFSLLIILLIVFVLIEADIRPVTLWDGWASWLLIPKIFFFDGTVKSEALRYVNSEYPLLVNLGVTYLYIFLHQINDRVILIYFWAYYAFTGFIFFAYLRHMKKNSSAYVFTFLLISTQNLIRHGGRFDAGDADLILGFYIFCSSIIFLFFNKYGKMKTLVLLQIFLAITSLIKNEGLFFSAMIEIFIAYTLLKTKNYNQLITILIWIIPIFDWQIYKILFHLPRIPGYISTVPHFERLFAILILFFDEFFNIPRWNFLWVLFLICFIYYLLQKRKTEVDLLYNLVFSQLIIYFIVYIFTNSAIGFVPYVQNTLDRLLLHLAPLALLASAMSFDSERYLKILSPKMKKLSL